MNNIIILFIYIYKVMLYQYNNQSYNINLAGNTFNKLQSGVWKLGLVDDNYEITNEDSDHYKLETFDRLVEKVEKKVFKNKVFVKLINGERTHAHIIHWCPTDGYFCITTDAFWDQFND